MTRSRTSTRVLRCPCVGATLAESAKQQKLKVVTIDAIDARKHGYEGCRDRDLPGGQKLVNDVFQAEIGTEPTAPDAPGRRLRLVRSTRNRPGRDASSKRSRTRLSLIGTAEQQKAALAKKARDIVALVKGGKALADVATELKIAVESKAGLRRGASDAVLSTDAVTAAFDDRKV